MITDSMSKYEVMVSLRKEFDTEIYPRILKRERIFFNLIGERSLREKKKIALPWERIRSKNQTDFEFQVIGDSESYLYNIVGRFFWKGRNCYANFYPDGEVLVSQGHCIDRYKERVLGDLTLSTERVFRKYLIKQGNVSHIVLPTLTHRFSVYHGTAGALFLGDFDFQYLDKKVNGTWLNTCISLKEARYTQTGILNTLAFMTAFVKKIGENPLAKDDSEYFDRAKCDNDFKSELIRFYSQTYMLLQLHLSFQFPFTRDILPNINERMEHISERLREMSISTNSLSPYGRMHGIALKGEIDYKEI